MADNEFFEGFLDDYFAECEEHLTAARSALLTLEASEGQPGAERKVVDELFRFYHSLKGISAMVELRPAEQLAHELESYLRVLRAGDLSVTAAGISTLIEGTLLLERIINARRLEQTPPSIDDMTARIAALVSRATGAARAAEMSAPHEGDTGAKKLWKCIFAPTRELLATGVGVDGIRRRLGEIGTIVDAAPVVGSDGAIVFVFTFAAAADLDAKAALQSEPVLVEAVDRALEPAAAPSNGSRSIDEGEPSVGPAAISSHIVRVDLARLDELMRNVGDLVISRARLMDRMARFEPHVPSGEWRSVQEDLSAIDRHVRTLREGLMRVRLVPIGEIFRRMPFVVRDLARESGKKVTLLLQGQATEIDKYLIERMMDPVLHLVRNAVSHGIETPEERIAAGKRPEGTITLSAAAAGEIVTLEIADDGRGVDATAVVARAKAAGLRVPDGPLDSAVLLELLCAPGLSTKDAADRASGRGVGMAVVKDTVDQLSGSMVLESEQGTGTRFRIQLPLTLAIADALIGRVGTQAFAVPQSAVREVIEVSASEVRAVEQNEVIPYRDGALSLMRLSHLFGMDAPLSDRFHAFVIGSGRAMVGLAVDRIIGQREIVVRAVTDPLLRVEGISGATDLGDGRVVLILDPAALVEHARTRAGRAVARAPWGRVRA